jgi:TRAP-type C4-dicarboxylate transport system permease small subunit
MKGATVVGADPGEGGALGAIDRAVHVIERGTALISGFGIFLMMMFGVAQIISRKVLNWPIPGYIDIVEIMMTFLVFLGLAYTERLGGHIRMEILVNFLKGRTLWLFELTGVIVGLFVCAVLTKYSWDHAIRAYTSGDSTIDIQLLWWPSKMVVPAALALLFIRLLVSLWGYLRLVISPTAIPVGVPEIIDVEEQARRDVEAAGIDLNNDAEGKSNGPR